MNVLSLVSYPFLPARSGGQKGIALFYKYFSRYHRVTIVTTKKNDPANAEGYTLLNILSNSRLRYINPFLFFTIRKQLRKAKAERLILEHPYYGWLGMLLKKICGIPLVVHSHNIEGNRWKSLGKWWWRMLWHYEKMTHRFADFNFFIQDEDRLYAITAFGLDPARCLTVSFGTEVPEPVSATKRLETRKKLRQQLQVSDNTFLLLFNGAFRYAPNIEALQNLLTRVNPLLQSRNTDYLLLILGLDIPDSVKESNLPGVRILGFVEDLDFYLTGCQVFLNPVYSGGGIKTKLVEAIAYGLNVVSSENGAIGVDPALCKGKLIVCPDGDWQAFADAVFLAEKSETETPLDFFNHFYWGNITERAARFIELKK
jgi:polysaccharide biosynthesis protein PslH